MHKPRRTMSKTANCKFLSIMKNNQLVSLKRSFFLLLLAGGMIQGCKKEDQPEARQIKLIVYTFIGQSQFDRIEVSVDDKVVGEITTPDTTVPGCTSTPSPNALYVPVTSGKHKWSAKQYKNGELTGEWSNREKDADGENCSYIKLDE